MMPASCCTSRTPSRRAPCPRRCQTSSGGCGRTRASKPASTAPLSTSSMIRLD